MVGHDDEGIYFQGWVRLRYSVPDGLYDLTRLTQLHLPIHHVAKQAFTIPYTKGNKIGPRLRIIISLQTNRPTFVPWPFDTVAIDFTDPPELAWS